MSRHSQNGNTDMLRVGLRVGYDPRVQAPEPPDREQHRSSIARQYADLGQELGLDAQTHEQLIDTLVDLQLQAIERYRLRHGTGLARKADAVTAKLTAIRTLIGDEGLDRYHNYMAVRFERDRVRALDDRLAPQDKLGPEQRRRLIDLLAEYDEQLMDPRRTYRDTSWMPDLSQEESKVIGQLDMLAASEENLRRVQRRNPALAARASQFLSPAQLAEFARFNEEGAATLARKIDQQRASLDPVQVAAVTQRIAEAQRDWQTPVPGEITFELNVTVDEAEPVIMTYRRPNGAPVTIEIDELSIEVTASLLPRRSLRLAVVHFGELGGKRRQLDAPASHIRCSGYYEEKPIEAVRADVVHGRLKGHIVRTTVRVLE